MSKSILIACEHSQTLTREFHELGFDVLSCDLKSSSGELPHYQGSVFDVINQGFDAMVGFPPCMYLAKCQMHRYYSEPGRYFKALRAMEFFDKLLNCPIPLVALENPVGLLNSQYSRPNDKVSPIDFGDPYRKEICLWLKGLPPLIKTCFFSGKTKHVSNHVNGRMSQDLKSEIKSSWKYYPQMSKAIATQWAGVINNS